MPKSDLTAKSTTSKSDVWGTPPRLAQLLVAEFDLRVDVAATAKNTKCEGYFGPDHDDPLVRDALVIEWRQHTFTPRFFLNPPFSLLPAFVAQATVALDSLTVAVLPAKTEMPWWHLAVPLASEVRFLKARLRYEQPDPETGVYARGDSALFPSVVVVWDNRRGRLRGGPRFTWWDWREE